MKNTVAGASFILASMVCIVMLGITGLYAGDTLSIICAGFLLVAWFINVCLGIYYFNAEDKTGS
jgi:hypothetical protein